MPSPAETAAFQAILIALATHAATNTPLDPAGYPDAVDPYLAAAATLTAQWYHDLAPDAAFAVEIPPQIDRDALFASARWAATQTDPREALALATEKRVFDASRQVVAVNAAREGVRYARYASANACPWCRVLASRGPVYRTAEAAAHGHNGDHCIAVPDRQGNPYQAPDYISGWEAEYVEARKQVGGNLDDIVNYMRRQETSPTPGD